MLVLLFVPAPASSASTPRSYAHQLALAQWHSEAEWRALDAVVMPESGWNPCRRYPSTTECSYDGPNSCGIPQANPCPREWRGRLAETWRAQVRWLISYVVRRYRTPLGALAARAERCRRGTCWY